ncbi:MAG: ribosomal L7Ae/L30e/S12e/Gadd45 family protein [Clostridiaceae bacterium]|nr:ribosomal L7Ae/L30e/S12e/Gadd45 family protein [Clostridiaceae bacterium]
MNQKKQKQKLEPGQGTPEMVYRMIGLAIRAGRAATGTEAVLKALSHGQTRLVIVAEDTAAGTSRQVETAAARDAVPVNRFGSKTTLGHWTGHEERAIVAINDQGFADRLQMLIDCLPGRNPDPGEIAADRIDSGADIGHDGEDKMR